MSENDYVAKDQPAATVSREAQVTIHFTDGEPSITLSDAEARAVYSALRKWYGRGK